LWTLLIVGGCPSESDVPLIGGAWDWSDHTLTHEEWRDGQELLNVITGAIDSSDDTFD
jgi:hypothetical protein